MLNQEQYLEKSEEVAEAITSAAWEQGNALEGATDWQRMFVVITGLLAAGHAALILFHEKTLQAEADAPDSEQKAE